MRFLIGKLTRLPKPMTVCLAVTMSLLTGLLDYVTGYDFLVTAVYLLPILWASWAVGRKMGHTISALCAVLFGVANALSGHVYRDPLIPFWNVMMLLAVFVVVVEILTALKTGIAEREDLQNLKFKTDLLLERQEKLAVLGTLTAGIAHEIRNPLTSLKARLFTLEKHLQAVPGARKDVDILNSEISRLDRIVKDALSFAQPSVPDMKIITTDTLLLDVQGLVASGLWNRGINFVVETSPDLRIYSDSGHLKQVLINLVNNAADAIDGEGTITVRTRVLGGGQEAESAVLEVSDTGTGIPSEVEKRLFDPFFSTKESGTGLGLSIAARIVEKLGGKLEYQTQLGHGTTFGVVLPSKTKESVRSGQNQMKTEPTGFSANV